MENVEFLGEFSLRNQDHIGDMPILNASGFWRAWRLSDGSLVVQPLDDGLTPWGTYYPMPDQDFLAMLKPYPDIPETSGTTDGQAGQAWHDGVDILSVWYEEASSGGQGAASSAAAKGEGGLPDPRGRDALAEARAPARGDLAPSSPPRQPAAAQDGLARGLFADPFFLEDELTEEPDAFSPSTPGLSPGQGAAANSGLFLEEEADPDAGFFSSSAAPVSGYRHPSSIFTAAEESVRPPAGEAPVILPPRTPGGQTGGPEEPESRRAYLEAFMREEFQSLTENLDESPYPALEEEIARLLSLGTDFTWEQKYMFTEFGLTLRRKQKPRLTLISHMRAMQLAPDDEHVLFNVARALYDTGDIDGARKYLRRALDVAPDFKLAADFLRFLAGRIKGV